MESFFEIQQNQVWLVLVDQLAEDDVPRLNSEMQSWIDSLGKTSAKDLFLDLGAVDMVSSGALRLLLTMARRIHRERKSLVLTNLSPRVADSLATSGFLDVFDVQGGITTIPRKPPHFPDRPGIETPQLDLALGDQVFAVSDGDTLGTCGKFLPELLQLPGIAERHVTFHLADQHWTAMIGETTGTKTQLDGISLSPGQLVPLKSAHTLQLANLRVHLQLTPAFSAPVEAAKHIRSVSSGAKRAVEAAFRPVTLIFEKVGKFLGGIRLGKLPLPEPMIGVLDSVFQGSGRAFDQIAEEARASAEWLGDWVRWAIRSRSRLAQRYFSIRNRRRQNAAEKPAID
jgi:anti-anti-sigma factor